jgi:hypothetical protein
MCICKFMSGSGVKMVFQNQAEAAVQQETSGGGDKNESCDVLKNRK